ncbi:MAG TPA: alginate lyase family protein [Rhodanobacteraceae bacterium]|nr:alginate lyase family protein [Rhodanobacteraceae bacterium]
MTDLAGNLPRLLRTLRYLRPVQVWGRVWLRAYRPRVDMRAAPALRAAAGSWQGCARRPSMLGPNTFRFLNVEHALDTAADWNRADWQRLWLYNLHYFDDLAADGMGVDQVAASIAASAAPTAAPTAAPAAGVCRSGGSRDRSAWHHDLIARWIHDNPPAHGTGWEPYPTSLRIVNWIKWVLAGNAMDPDALHNLAVQTRWLRRRLEIHLLGNHLWANAKALVFAGAFFDGDESRRWLYRGMALVRRELAEQILPDGGHFERSPMYHAIVLEDVLDLVQLAECFPPRFDAADVDAWRKTATRMLRWLRVMTHPDGGIALFNDAALGIAPDCAALTDYAKRLGVVIDEAPLQPVEALPDSGYVRLQSDDAVLIADVGEIGPDYLPGHAHADTLSFELSLRGERVLVNGGTSTYESNAERLRQRGTAAHNTVIVDGEDSSEVWSAFRVGRRAHPLHVEYGEDASGSWLRAAHDGYAHRAGHPVHHREWRLSESALTINDRIDGRCGRAESRYRVAPSWRVTATADQAPLPFARHSGAYHREPLINPVPRHPGESRDPVTFPQGIETQSRWVPDIASRFRDDEQNLSCPTTEPGIHALAESATTSATGTMSSCTAGPTFTAHWQSQPAAKIRDASYHAGFNLAEPCRLIEVPLDAQGASFTLAWQ